MTKLNPSNDSDDRDERIVALERALVAAHARADALSRVSIDLHDKYAHLMAWETITDGYGEDVYIVASEGVYEIPWHGVFNTEEQADQYRDFLDGLPELDRLECHVYTGRIHNEYALAFWNSYDDPEVKGIPSNDSEPGDVSSQ